MGTISGVRRLALQLVWTLIMMNHIQVHGSDITFEVREEQPKGTYIGSVAEKSRVADKLSPDDLLLLEYSFLNPSNAQDNALFRIDGNNGKVYTSRRIDREVICENSLYCEREVMVTVKSSVISHLKLYTIKFVIVDINDNQPTFSTDVITLYIPESAIVGTKYAIEGAVDKDMGPNNSIQSYELLKPNSAFGIESEKKLDGSSIVKIVLLKRLNRENRDLYNFFVVAKDGGVPQKTGSVTINVNVRDINDNKPVFRRQKYNFNVKESTGVNSIIGRVKATDKDIGENGRVSYRFSPLRPGRLEDLLSINPVSGELTVKAQLQYESGKSYQTIVEAADNGNPPQVSQTVLHVRIIDTGNNPPKLKLNLQSPVNADTILLKEGSKIDMFVGHIKVEDRDPGSNGVVICRSENPYFRVQKLESKGYALMISKELDREETDKHKVDIICEDSGTPRLSSYVSFNVEVTDVNDMAPKFLRSSYNATVTEGMGEGVEVLRVKALDLDLGVNSQFIYQLTWDSNSMFKIDYDTGIITTNAVFDRETMTEVKFTVKAVDQTDKSLVGTTTVLVDILDVNDNTPTIEADSLRIEVPEDIPIGGDVGKLIGRDLDAGKNARLSFRLTDTDPRIPFVVFKDGTIRTSRQLDRETLDHYEFDVTVSDDGDYPLSSGGHVRVHLLDVNDNHPVIEFPNSDNDSVIVVSDLAPGSIVAKIMAYDDDLAQNAELSYSIVDENSQSMFKLSPRTGEVILARRITPDDREGLLIKVSVHDLGSPQLEKRQNLEIKILFTNATLAARHQEVYGFRYVIIVGIVAGITIIVSIIIVVAIIKLRSTNRRNNDRGAVQEQGDQDKTNEKEALKSNSPKRVILATTESNSNFEFFTNSKMDKDPKFTLNKSPDGNYYSAPPGTDQYGKQEFLTFKKTKLVVGNEVDVRSNSSGETASDSGRGASEDEIHLTILAGGDGSYRKCQVSLSPDFEDFLPPPPYCFADQVEQLKQIAHTSTYPKPRAPKKEGPSASLHNISKYNKDHRQIPGTVGHIRKHPLGGSSGRIVYKPADADISEYPAIELRKLKSAAKGYPF